MGNGKLSKFIKLSEEIIGAAMEVHKTPGPGLLESAYEAALFYQFSAKPSHAVLRQAPVTINYKDQ